MQYSNKDYSPALHDRYKALSVKQPYAGYIANGEKTIEVRSKSTSYRGELLICASKDGKPEPNAPGFGCTIAFVDLYDCKPLTSLTDEEWKRTKLPEYLVQKLKQPGRGYGWFLKNPRRVIEFPVKGQLGIFNLVYTKGVIMEYPRILKDPVIE